MKINKSTRIIGNNVILVPYKEHHVRRYHEWMESQELQRLTASEPLTLDEEYKMQQNWFEDKDKCTFIILNKHLFEKTADEIGAMIGDTNFYLNDPDNENFAEIEIMIAELSNRGKGLGWESVVLMMRYGIENLNIQKYTAKISMDNQISLKMFNKLGFVETSKSQVFQEVTVEKQVSSDWYNRLVAETAGMTSDNNYV
ncbi:N-acetyltransferase 9-like protein [Copidosoma floridanum]|uniref:N-acetyltransferase 9-like protein n=1 Tax=Copidosoma floridanum TaxID=29053 RepID=UPI0006C95C36|nr:N-acetyltransferase 9-like protein [Copidosoma floridanum]